MELVLIFFGIIFLGLSFGWVELDDLTPPKDSKPLNKKWHAAKAGFQICFSGAIGISKYQLTWDAAYFALWILALTAIVFNITINIVRKRGNILYVANSGLEGLFYKRPFIYYLLLFGLIILLTLKLKLWN
jgi:hypothetical protein